MEGRKPLKSAFEFSENDNVLAADVERGCVRYYGKTKLCVL